VVRQLLEIETYRHLVLLGLAVARYASGQLSAYEAAVSAEVAAMAGDPSASSNRERLDGLRRLSIDAGQLLDQTSYRFAASRAYGDIVIRRLERLAEEPIGDNTLLSRYLLNRLEPALATCTAIEKRQASLLDRLGWATRLLDTQIELDIDSKNEKLLASINETAQSQLRLQFTVEGLSTIAITYYALGIVGYVLDGVSVFAGLDKHLTLALIAPVLLVLVWRAVTSVRRRRKK
jgi:uncharacterized membrane-anchored protein